MTEGTRRKRTRARYTEGDCLVPDCPAPAASYAKWVCEEHAWDVRANFDIYMGAIVLKADIGWTDTYPGLLAKTRRESKERDEHPGFIYYLRIGGHYKIGWAKRLEQRLKAYPPDGAVLAVHQGSRQDEGKLHKRFGHLTTAGREWYPLVPDITRHIQIMVEEHGEPDPELRCGPKPVGIKRPQHYRDGPTGRGWTGGRRAS